MDTTFIYTLSAPETGECRYVGKANNPKKRFWRHLADARNGEKCHRADWIRSLLARDLKPHLEIIDEVPFEHWPQLEVAYIEFFLERGLDLVNGTSGGEDPPSGVGKKHSPETRAKISAAKIGKKFSPAHRAALVGRKCSPEKRNKISASLRGKKRSPEAIAKTAAALKGKNLSPAHRAKIKSSNLGKKRSSETRARISAAQLGKKLSPETCAKMSVAAKRRHESAKLDFPNE